MLSRKVQSFVLSHLLSFKHNGLDQSNKIRPNKMAHALLEKQTGPSSWNGLICWGSRHPKIWHQFGVPIYCPLLQSKRGWRLLHKSYQPHILNITCPCYREGLLNAAKTQSHWGCFPRTPDNSIMFMYACLIFIYPSPKHTGGIIELPIPRPYSLPGVQYEARLKINLTKFEKIPGSFNISHDIWFHIEK